LKFCLGVNHSPRSNCLDFGGDPGLFMDSQSYRIHYYHEIGYKLIFSSVSQHFLDFW